MKHKYRFHPSDYELGENEKFYSDMEARGWRLVKRGHSLSKFVPAEPGGARYRIEVFAPGFLEQSVLPEEQVAVFADCGWEYAASSGLLHIFRTPAGSGAPEFYADPRQQAETLKRMKQGAMWGWIPTTALSVLNLLLLLSTQGGGRISGQIRACWAAGTSLFLLTGVLLLLGLCRTVRDAWSISRTYRRLNKGIPLDHNPGGGSGAYRLARRILWGAAAVCLVLTAAQLLATRTGVPADRTGEPYLLLSDLGWEGEPTSSILGDPEKAVFTPSLLAEYWDVREFLETSGGQEPWLFQDVYRLRDGRMARWLAEGLMNAARLGGQGSFSPLEAEGLDAAWTNSRLELVAVKGNLVISITYMPGSPNDFDPLALCEALAERWARER